MKAVDEGFEFVNGKSLTSTIEKLIKSHHPNVIYENIRNTTEWKRMKKHQSLCWVSLKLPLLLKGYFYLFLVKTELILLKMSL